MKQEIRVWGLTRREAIIHRGPYYLWGDVFILSPMKFPHKTDIRRDRPTERARIPFQLAYQVALLCKSTK